MSSSFGSGFGSGYLSGGLPGFSIGGGFSIPTITTPSPTTTASSQPAPTAPPTMLISSTIAAQFQHRGMGALIAAMAALTDVTLGSDAHTGSETVTASSIITLVSEILKLQQAWSKKLSQGAQNVFAANMQVPGNPAGTAGVATAIQNRNIDSTKSNQETGVLDQIVQGQKAMSQTLARILSALFSLAEPLAELSKTQVSALQGFLK